ncbi:MAG: TerD family protein [Tissierellales bacterium]|jgi:tellurium resistance protein TerD|nr:TerD family protein [Tissierellales bacterium]
MKIKVESGKREGFQFHNSKISVVGSEGIFHDGHIDLTNGSKPSVSQSVQAQNNTVINQTSGNVEKTADIKQFESNSPKLKSGQKLQLDLVGLSGELNLGVAWRFKGAPFEIDLSMFLSNEMGKTEENNFYFYGNKKAPNGSVSLDDVIGNVDKSYFHTVAGLNLNRIDPSITKISVTATLYDENKNFGELESGYLYFLDKNGKDYLSYEFINGMTSENAIVICEIYKHNGNWKINGIGRGFFGGLEALCGNFGIETT